MAGSKYIAGQLYNVPVSDIDTHPLHPRKGVADDSVARLGESIKAVGLLSPLQVFWDEDQAKFIVMAGKRRFLAAHAEGLQTVPCMVVEGDGDPVGISLSENRQREDLPAVAEAESLQYLVNAKGFELGRLVSLTGDAKPTVSQKLSLTRLPLEVRDDCREDLAVPWTILAEIAKFPTEGEMTEVYRRYRKENLTRKQVEAIRLGKKAPQKATAHVVISNAEKSINTIADKFERLSLDEMRAVLASLESLVGKASTWSDMARSRVAELEAKSSLPQPFPAEPLAAAAILGSARNDAALSPEAKPPEAAGGAKAASARKGTKRLAGQTGQSHGGRRPTETAARDLGAGASGDGGRLAGQTEESCEVAEPAGLSEETEAVETTGEELCPAGEATPECTVGEDAMRLAGQTVEMAAEVEDAGLAGETTAEISDARAAKAGSRASKGHAGAKTLKHEGKVPDPKDTARVAFEIFMSGSKRGPVGDWLLAEEVLRGRPS